MLDCQLGSSVIPQRRHQMPKTSENRKVLSNRRPGRRPSDAPGAEWWRAQSRQHFAKCLGAQRRSHALRAFESQQT